MLQQIFTRMCAACAHGDQYPASALLCYSSSVSGLWWEISGEIKEGRITMSDIKPMLLLQRKWNNMQWEWRYTPNHSPPRLLLPSLMGIQMQRNLSKKTDLGSQCFMLQRIMQFLKFFFENICFPNGVTSWTVIYFFHFVHSYQCVYFHSHALETEVLFPLSILILVTLTQGGSRSQSLTLNLDNNFCPPSPSSHFTCPFIRLAIQNEVLFNSFKKHSNERSQVRKQNIWLQ